MGYDRAPRGPEIREKIIKINRSRTGDDRRYQKLSSTPRIKKVAIV